MNNNESDSVTATAKTYCLTPLLEYGIPTQSTIPEHECTIENGDLIAYSLLNPYTEPHQPTIEKQIENNELPALIWQQNTLNSTPEQETGLVKLIEPAEHTQETTYYFHATKNDMIFLMGLYYGLKNTMYETKPTFSLPNDRIYWYILSFNTDIFSGKEANYFHGMMPTHTVTDD